MRPPPSLRPSIPRRLQRLRRPLALGKLVTDDVTTRGGFPMVALLPDVSIEFSWFFGDVNFKNVLKR